jgi:hypothetical protein
VKRSLAARATNISRTVGKTTCWWAVPRTPKLEINVTCQETGMTSFCFFLLGLVSCYSLFASVYKYIKWKRTDKNVNQVKQSKGKVVPVLNWAPRREGVLEDFRYSSTHSLTLALDGGEWSASRAGRFTPRGKAPSTHWIGGWVGPRAVLNAVVKGKIPTPAGNPTLEPRSSNP